MAVETIFDTGTTKTQGVLFYVGRHRFQFYLNLLYGVNFALLSVTIIFCYKRTGRTFWTTNGGRLITLIKNFKKTLTKKGWHHTLLLKQNEKPYTRSRSLCIRCLSNKITTLWNSTRSLHQVRTKDFSFCLVPGWP
jgi:hypothetical protein